MPYGIRPCRLFLFAFYDSALLDFDILYIQNLESDSYGVFVQLRDCTLHIQYYYLTADIIVSPVVPAF